jgi:F-type H+-transporting ATPase subunit b
MSLINVADLAASSAASAAGGGVVVDFDVTALFMAGLFVALWIILKPLLFDPMLKLFEERERRTDGVKLLARKIDEKSEKALTTYEDEMAKARAAANAEREKIRGEGLKREAEILARVRAATAQALEAGRKQTQDEVAQVRAALKNDVNAIAKDLASRALGREVHG